MATGKVKFFNEAKGFGFIKTDNGDDIFVHANDVQNGPLRENDSVEFDVEKGKKGLNAVQVKKV